jgi:glycine cleavage system H protein
MKDEKNMKYKTKSDEWINDKDNLVGITDHAQKELGDIVYVDLPDTGHKYEKGECFAVVESIKTVTDVFMPVTGIIVKTNEQLLDHPELVNKAPEGKGWLVKLGIENKYRSQFNKLEKFE